MFDDKTETETPTNEEEVTEEETSEETTEETEETEEEETPETTPEEIVELKKKADLADNYKIRAEKAEGKLKKTPKTEVKTEEGTLSQQDVIYLAKADIHEDDVDEVAKYASKNNVTVKEAHAYLKPILDVRTEERTTADATNTKKGGRGGSKQDGESFLKKAEQTGEVPTDEAGMMKLAEARMARLKQKK